VRLQPLAQPSSRRKEAQGENALRLHAEVSVSDKCRERLERRVRYKDSRKATLYIELTLKKIFYWAQEKSLAFDPRGRVALPPENVFILTP